MFTNLLMLFSLFTRFYKFITGEDFVWRLWLPKLFSFIVCLYFNFNFAYSYAIFRLLGLAIDGFLVMVDSVDYLVRKEKLKEGWKVYIDVIAMHIFYRMLLKFDGRRILRYVVDRCLNDYPFVVLILNCGVIPLLYNYLIKMIAYALWPKVGTVITYVPKLWCYLTEYYAKAYNKVIEPIVDKVATNAKKVASDVCEVFISIEQACVHIKGAQKEVGPDSPDYKTYNLLNKIVSVRGIFKDIPEGFKSYVNKLVSLAQCYMTIKEESGCGFVKCGSIALNHVSEPIVCNDAFSDIVAIDSKTITHEVPVVNGRCYMLNGRPISTSGLCKPKRGKGKLQRPLHDKNLKTSKTVYARHTTPTVICQPVYVDFKTGKPLNVDEIIYNIEHEIEKIIPAPYPMMTKDEYLEYLKDYKHSGESCRYHYSDGFNPSNVGDVRLSVPLKKSYATTSTPEIETTAPVIKTVPVVNIAQRVSVFQDKPKTYHNVLEEESESFDWTKTEPKAEPKAEPKPVETVKLAEVKPYGYMEKYSNLLDRYDFKYVETLTSKKGKFLLVFQADIDGWTDDGLEDCRSLIEDCGKSVIELKTIEFDDYKTGKRTTLESGEEVMYIMVCLQGSQDKKLEEAHRHNNHVYNKVVRSTIEVEDQNVSAQQDSDGDEIKTYKRMDLKTPDITTTESEHIEDSWNW